MASGQRSIALALLLLAASPGGAASAPTRHDRDGKTRTAILCAFEPEWARLQTLLRHRHDTVLDGTVFATGDIAAKPVVLFMSGMSMVNAAMATQAVIDHFPVGRIIVAGVAGGADPKLSVGDVVVPARWREYLESTYARRTVSGFVLSPFVAKPDASNFDMMFPQPVLIARPYRPPEARTWFSVDDGLLELARAARVRLNRCLRPSECLAHQPRIVVGGNGVSGSAFVDNAAFRTYANRTFGAEALDMESAAVAHVAYVDRVPFLALRSVSDLAGAEHGDNGITNFAKLAADNSARLLVAILERLPPSRRR